MRRAWIVPLSPSAGLRNSGASAAAPDTPSARSASVSTSASTVTAELEVEAVLHEMRAPLKQVLALQVGDTLMFDARPNELVTLRCGEWTLSQGRVGRIDDKIAVQLVRPLRRSRTTLAAFEASMTNQREGPAARS